MTVQQVTGRNILGLPDVTVVVISRNRRADLIASLPRHDAPVVLVRNGLTDGTVRAALLRVRPVRAHLPAELRRLSADAA